MSPYIVPGLETTIQTYIEQCFSFELDKKITNFETDVVVAHPGVTRSRLYRRSNPSLSYKIIDKFKTNVSTGVAPVIEASSS